MKCVKLKNGNIVRATDDDAAILVSQGATYTNKSEWRAAGRYYY